MDSAGRTMIVETAARSKSSVRTRLAFVFLPGTGSGGCAKAVFRTRSMLLPAAAIELKFANRSPLFFPAGGRRRRAVRIEQRAGIAGLVRIEAEERRHAGRARKAQIIALDQPRERALRLFDLAANDLLGEPPPGDSLEIVHRLWMAHEISQDFSHHDRIKFRIQAPREVATSAPYRGASLQAGIQRAKD